MNVLYLLIPISVLLGAVFVALFILATKKNQYDDLDGPPIKMLFDDEKPGNLDKKKEEVL